MGYCLYVRYIVYREVFFAVTTIGLFDDSRGGIDLIDHLSSISLSYYARKSVTLATSIIRTTVLPKAAPTVRCRLSQFRHSYW